MSKTDLTKTREKRLDVVSKKLTSKYGRKTSVDETKYLNQKTKAQQAWEIVTWVIVGIILAFCVMVCLGTFVNAIKKAPKSMFGFSTLQVVSGSMTADSIEIKGQTYPSGFNIGDKLVIRMVDTKSLRIGDKIAFFAYPENYVKYHSLNKQEITLPDTPTRYKTTFGQFWGFHTSEIYEASGRGAMLVFHHITNIYEDQNGKYWFKTQGSANATKDIWFISEEMVLGIYDESKMGQFILGVIDFTSSKTGFMLLLLIPILSIVAILVQSIGKHLYLSMLELDVVEQKRKLTDDVCVKHEVGYFMDTPTKYKVLSQASKKEIPTYVSLLWKDGEEPYALNKYVKKKHLVLYPIKKLLTLNQICEAHYNEGEEIKKIASFYDDEKHLIKSREKVIKKRIKLAHKLVKEKRRQK